VKGKPPRIPDDIRAVCREVLGLDNLAIRKRLKTWFESGDGLGSTTFRHVMLMGYGQPKHSMISGDQQRQTVIFATTHGYQSWDPRAPGAAEMNARSQRMIEGRGDQGPGRGAGGREGGGHRGQADHETDLEALESVTPPPEDPGAHGGGRGR
jgi:hypothetical protein